MRDSCPSCDARLAQTAVGVDARVHQLNELSDPLGGAGAGKGVNTPAIQLAESMPPTVAILVDRTQRGRRGEPRLALDPGAVSPGSIRRSQAFQHHALEAQGDDRLVRRECRRLRLGQADPLAQRKRFAQSRVPVLPTASSDIFAIYGEQVEGHEPQPLRRGSPAREYGAGDRGEVLCRLAVTFGDDDQLTVKGRSGRHLGKRAEQRSQPRRQVGAVPRSPAHLSPGSDVDQESREPSHFG